MIHLGAHPNVVNLLGACTVKGNLLVILEYCAKVRVTGRMQPGYFLAKSRTIIKISTPLFFLNWLILSCVNIEINVLR